MAQITPTEIVSIVNVILDVLHELRASGVLKDHSTLTPALDKARKRLADHFAAPPEKPAEKGA